MNWSIISISISIIISFIFLMVMLTLMWRNTTPLKTTAWEASVDNIPVSNKYKHNEAAVFDVSRNSGENSSQSCSNLQSQNGDFFSQTHWIFKRNWVGPYIRIPACTRNRWMISETPLKEIIDVYGTILTSAGVLNFFVFFFVRHFETTTRLIPPGS